MHANVYMHIIQGCYTNIGLGTSLSVKMENVVISETPAVKISKPEHIVQALQLLA